MATPVKPIPRVVDVYHGDLFNFDVKKSLSLADDFAAMASVGMWGIIHKATQGVGVTDKTFHQRIAAAKAAGFLCGAYHFNTGESISNQVNHFFDVAQPDNETAMVLDWEDNRASQMSLSEFADFCTLADQKLGRPIKVYSGNRAKELLTNASKEIRDLCAKRDLWGCQYGPAWRGIDSSGKPLPFKQLWLWQYTGDGIGQPPHDIPGIATKGIDLNHFPGTRDELKAMWIS